jgi:hypothetical protein
MNLYVLITDGGDGSYYPQYTLNPELIEKLEAAYDRGTMDYENGIGCDGDGFHYSTIEVPEGSTPKTLKISVLEDTYADRFLRDDGDE